MWGVFGVAGYICVYAYVYVYVYVLALGVVGTCSSVSVVDFGQVNTSWVLMILMARFLLTNNIFD